MRSSVNPIANPNPSKITKQVLHLVSLRPYPPLICSLEDWILPAHGTTNTPTTNSLPPLRHLCLIYRNARW